MDSNHLSSVGTRPGLFNKIRYFIAYLSTIRHKMIPNPFAGDATPQEGHEPATARARGVHENRERAV